MNYLGLVGLLGLTGERDGPPVQAAGQIADLGGGALMAAFGIMAALHERERERRGLGQLVDVSMADGALSWLALVAGRYFADRTRASARRAGARRGRSICYRPYECADGWVTLGALEPKFWRAWCEGVGREDLVAAQFELPGSEVHREVQRIFRARTRAEWLRVRGAARLLPGADPGARRGARVGAGAGARDGRGASPAGRRRVPEPVRCAARYSR